MGIERKVASLTKRMAKCDARIAKRVGRVKAKKVKLATKLAVLQKTEADALAKRIEMLRAAGFSVGPAAEPAKTEG